MLNIELDGTEPEHVERIAPKMSTDAQGNITWVPSLLDHNAKTFHRGKTVSNEEFNELFLHQVYRGNYLTDTLSQFFGKHLSSVVRNKFTNDFKLVPSYIKTFTSADWGELQEDGYYYITISPEEHGFTLDMDESALDRINIDIEMYLLNSDGLFYEVTQVYIDTDNVVHVYTDDTTIPGFVVVRANEKSYAMVTGNISASQVEGLHSVALSGKYSDLIDINEADGPNTKIKQNADDIISILTGTNLDGDIVTVAQAIKAVEAEDAYNLIGSINNIDIKNIFEDNATSYIVKEATLASNYKANGGIANKFSELQNNITTSQNTLDSKITNVQNTLNNSLTEKANTAATMINNSATYCKRPGYTASDPIITLSEHQLAQVRAGDKGLTFYDASTNAVIPGFINTRGPLIMVREYGTSTYQESVTTIPNISLSDVRNSDAKKVFVAPLFQIVRVRISEAYSLGCYEGLLEGWAIVPCINNPTITIPVYPHWESTVTSDNAGRYRNISFQYDYTGDTPYLRNIQISSGWCTGNTLTTMTRSLDGTIRVDYYDVYV